VPPPAPRVRVYNVENSLELLRFYGKSVPNYTEAVCYAGRMFVSQLKILNLFQQKNAYQICKMTLNSTFRFSPLSERKQRNLSSLYMYYERLT